VPNRSPEARQLIDSLEIREPDRFCNARTPNGYCKQLAGFRTEHLSTGRCYLHGGLAGRPIVSGLYSEKLTIKLRDEYEKLLNDPLLANLYSELGMLKLLFSDLLERISDQMEDGDDIWVAKNRFGEEITSPRSKALITLADSISKVIGSITAAEEKSGKNLSIGQVQIIIQQIKVYMGETCGDCPVRKQIGSRLSEVKIEPIQVKGKE
jgi:hypothetical protein